MDETTKDVFRDFSTFFGRKRRGGCPLFGRDGASALLTSFRK
jgi:hypothetical protein